jgi:hypothetical protein
MEKSAPYADTPIVVSVQSSVGLRYRTWSCMECGQPFLEREGDAFYRIGNTDLPGSAKIDTAGTIAGHCVNCTQRYTVTVSFNVGTKREGIPLYMQPQSMFVTSEPVKKLRDVYCYECGKAFFSISDRIRMLVDNIVPIELLDSSKLGPLEARCKFQHCKQRWYVRV